MASAEAKEVYRDFIQAINRNDMRRATTLYNHLTRTGLISQFVGHTQELIRDLYNEALQTSLRHRGAISKGGGRTKKTSSYGTFFKKNYDQTLSFAENSKRISKMWKK